MAAVKLQMSSAPSFCLSFALAALLTRLFCILICFSEEEGATLASLLRVCRRTLKDRVWLFELDGDGEFVSSVIMTNEERNISSKADRLATELNRQGTASVAERFPCTVSTDGNELGSPWSLNK